MDTPAILEVVLSWAPLLLLIVIWMLLMRRIASGRKHQSDFLSELKRQNQILERVAAALETRGSSVERPR